MGDNNNEDMIYILALIFLLAFFIVLHYKFVECM